MKNKKINICLVGVGSIGSVHFDAYKSIKNINLFIIEKDSNKIEKLSIAGFKVFDDLSKIDLSIIDLFDICLPTPCHKLTIEKLVKLPRAKILCEKPLTESLATTIEVLSKIKKPKNLFCAFTERFHEPFMIMKAWTYKNPGPYTLDFVRRTKIPPSNHWTRHKTDKPNILLDLGIHDIDLALWLTSSNPLNIKAYTIGELSTSFTSKFSNKSDVSFYEGWDLPEDDNQGILNKVKLIASNGNFIEYDSSSEEIITNTENKQIRARFPEAYYDEIKHAINLARSDTDESRFPQPKELIAGIEFYEMIKQNRPL